MNIYNILGYFLISLPFIGLIIFVLRIGGWKDLLIITGIVGSIMFAVIVGAYLIALP